MKVVGDFKVYNFHEENFSKFGIDLQEKGQTLETDFGTRFLKILGFLLNFKKELKFRICSLFFSN